MSGVSSQIATLSISLFSYLIGCSTLGLSPKPLTVGLFETTLHANERNSVPVNSVGRGQRAHQLLLIAWVSAIDAAGP